MVLNLARKWRSKHFDEVVGQELSIKILKNTLYLDHFFPVYLFSGQRGCGKTTTARIFASAINCQQLIEFQHNPKAQNLPCLQCSSCLAMQKGNHPDFIEIDAASHTGVDNVRQIIDAASLLPILGRKKIYLIDEAHMLSKAAFNAFLKILEEPPASVLFILATTDLQKIIETVKSRCFQLLFHAIDNALLIKHLMFVCQQEHIAFDEAGLAAIVHASQGSARDALNLLEQVRFSADIVDKPAVLQVLGECDDTTIIYLLQLCVQQKVQEIMQHVQYIQHFQAKSLWQRMIQLFHDMINMQYGLPAQHIVHQENLRELACSVSIDYIRQCLQIFYDNEGNLHKTVASTQLFIKILLDIAAIPFHKEMKNQSVPSSSQYETSLPTDQVQDAAKPFPVENRSFWETFLSKLPTLDDPLVESIFKQAHCKSCNDGNIVISWAAEFSFFQDLLENAAHSWKPLLEQLLGKPINCTYEFIGESVKNNVSQDNIKTTAPQLKPVISTLPKHASHGAGFKKFSAKKIATKKETVVDITDVEQWKTAHMLLNIFPGKITYVEEESHE